MLTTKRVNLGLHIGLHVVILFSFLTVFFFLYMSKIEKNSTDDAIGNIIDSEISSTMSEIYKWDKTIEPDKEIIDWNSVKKKAQKLIDDNRNDNKKVFAHNKKLVMVSIIIIVTIVLTWIGLAFYFSKSYDINFTKIFIENGIIFLFVGVLEFLFFTNTASKYIPVSPDFATQVIIDNIKKNVEYQAFVKKNN